MHTSQEAVMIFMSALIAIASATTTAMVCDLILFLNGEPTISSWLRAHPLWYWIPAGLMVLFLASLALHLFVFPGV